MRRYFVPLLLLLGLGAVTVWLLLPPADRPVLPAQTGQQLELPGNPPQATSPSPPTVVENTPALTRQVIEDLPITPAVADGMLVTVLRQGSEQPLANVDVYVQEFDLAADQEQYLEQAPSWAPLEQSLSFGATRYRTNANGTVRVPRIKRQGGVYAFGDQLLGLNPSVPANLSGCIIHAFPNPTLSIRVVDAEGAAAPQALVLLRKELSERVWGSRRTNTQGRCTLEYPMAFFSFLEMEEDTDPLGLDVAVLGGEARAVVLPLTQPPERLLVLQMPEASRLRIRVTDAEGQTFRRMVNLRAALQDPGSTLAKEGFLQPLTSLSLPMLPDMFPLEIGAVPHAGMVKITAQTADHVYSAEALVAAPAKAGEVLEVPLRMTAGRSKLTFVVRNQAGKLGKRIKLEAGVVPTRGEETMPRYHSLQADDQGLVKMTLEEGVEGKKPRELQVLLPPRGEHPLRVATLPLPQPFVPGVFHLGDAILEPAPVQLAGTVTDYQGDPIAMATFRLWQKPRNRDAQWNRVETYDCMTDAEGNFALRGVFPPGNYRLETMRSGYRSDVQEMRLGRQDLTIALASNLNISASLLVEDQIRHRDLRVRLEYLSPSGHSARRYPRIAEDFTFSSDIAAPDSARLVFLCAHTDRELYVQDLPALPPGGGDYPLGEIDLRGKIHLYQISVRAEDGTAVEGVSVKFPDGQSASPAEASFRMLSAAAQEDLALLANAYRSTQLTVEPGERTVVLEPGISVEIVLTGMAKQSRAVRPFLALRLKHGSQYLTQSNVNFDDAGHGMVTLSDPGTYALMWWGLPQDSLPEIGAVEVSSTDAQEIVVEDLNGQVFHLSPP